MTGRDTPLDVNMGVAASARDARMDAGIAASVPSCDELCAKTVMSFRKTRPSRKIISFISRSMVWVFPTLAHSLFFAIGRCLFFAFSGAENAKFCVFCPGKRKMGTYVAR